MPYMNVNEVESAITGLASAFPALCERIVLPNTTFEGRTHAAMRIGVGPADTRPSMLFIGGQHAREWGSCEILINFAADLCEAYDGGTGLVYGGKSYSAAEVQSILEDSQVYLLPCTNPDGRNHSQTAFAMWRKNRNFGPGLSGIDLNRNYDFLWDFGATMHPASPLVVSDDPTSDVYHGPAPHSEPEVQNVVWLLDNHPEIRWFIDVHSYSELLYYNWGDDQNQCLDPSLNFLNAAHDGARGLSGDAYKEYIPPDDVGEAACLAESMRSALQSVRGKTYTTGQSYALYPTTGTATDYPYSRHYADPTKTRTLGFLIEWGTEFQPPWAEMERIILDASSALVSFAHTAPRAEMSLELKTPTVPFNGIPVGETAYRSIRFAVSTGACPATLSIAAGPTVTSGPAATVFGTPSATSVTVPANSTQDAHLWLLYVGTGDGDSATGTVTVRWQETGCEWNVPITASSIDPPSTAVALVLDKSGSMDWASGFPAPLDTRVKVLRLAANHLVQVIAERHGIGVASFDTNSDPDMPIAPVGADVVGAGRIQAFGVISGHTPTGGGTSIGDGVIEGKGLLDANLDPYNYESLIVFTDGDENDPAWIADVTGLVNQRVFGVALGTASEVKPAKLDALTGGSGGYLLLTGNLTDDIFLLSKYFLQVLAGATNTDIVLDPKGHVAPGQVHRIPFHISDADRHVDVMLLVPAPQVVELVLETPSGQVIDPGEAYSNASVDFVNGQALAMYRVTLPTAVAGVPVDGGTWHARISIDRERGKKFLDGLRSKNRDDVAGGTGNAMYDEWLAHGLPYSLNVHAESHLRMRARLHQDSYLPGAMLTVRCVLSEGGVPLLGSASAYCVVTRPDGTEVSLGMIEVNEGEFELPQAAEQPGIYRFRVIAEGETVRGARFTREGIVTGSTYRHGDDPPPSSEPGRPGGTPGGDSEFCRLLACLLEGGAITPELAKRMEGFGLDVEAVRRCLERCKRG